MKKLNLWLSLSSLSVLLVTIERFSPTTKVVLQPYSYLHLHELIQMIFIILTTVLIPFMILRELSGNFASLKKKQNLLLSLLFIAGIYFYATGNGAHEIASYIFNAFCDTKKIGPGFCGSSFFDDYYFGNILYFVGSFLMVVSLILFEKQSPSSLDKKNWLILILNSLVFAFAIFAYAAFDRVLVGLAYSLITTITILILLVTSRKKYNQLPYTTYSLLTYSLGTLASLFVRYFH